MLEDQVTYLLQRYLGNYVRGLNREALKISVWRGDVELSNMQLKPEALDAMKLPIKVKAGFLGSVKLKVPWSRLGQEPVVVYLDQIFILAEPTKQVQSSSEDAIQEAKRSRVREIETKLLESWEQHKSETNTSWLGSLVNTIIGNLKLSITNVHIRYEDHDSNPGHPFAAGVTLHKLSAVTVDDFGRETFATGGALDRVQKTVELERLAVYFDSNICPWKVEKSWDDLLPSEWIQVFEMGNRNAEALESPNVHNYLLQPVTGSARYVKLQSNESKNMGQPLQKATVNLDDVTLCLSKDAYTDMLKLGDFITSFNKRLKYAHYRPTVLVKENPRAWWKYSYGVVVDEMKKASGKFSWDQVLRYAKLRKRYVTLYASLLKPEMDRAAIEDNKDIQDLDRELDIEVIIQWRMLAHKVLQQTAESDAYLNQQKAKSSWWSLGWGSSGTDESSPRSLTEEDWERLNKIIGYKEGSDEQFPTTHERGDLLLSVFEIHMKHNASKLVVDGKECLADLSCDGMEFSIKLYPEAKKFDFKLGSYRLLSPNGLLAESATTADSLSGVFSYKPLGAQLDWTFVAKASPCYMTYLKESIDQIVLFFKSTSAISQSLALETVAAVQVTLDGVRRSAQQHVTRALKERSRFTLDLDIAAPKITIPSEYCPDNVHATKLLLDLGNLMLSTQDYWESDLSDEKDRYLQFSMVLSDVSAFLVDGDYSWSQTALASSSSALEYSNRFLPVLDRCTIVLKLQQMQLETPFYPSSRLSLRLPSLGFHFSPARYHRLMQVAKIFQDEDNFSSDMISPWAQADFEGWAFLLSWKGVGNREAIWQRRYLLLVGPFLYVLESPASKVYKQYFSLRGKQVNQVPPEFSGNEDNVLAVHDTPHLNSKVVEGLNTVVLRFDTEDSCKTWQNRLHGAIYRASGAAAIANFSGSASSVGLVQSESSEFNALPELLNAEKLFITGVLDELKICFSCNYKSNQNLSAILLGRENRLFEFRAIGGQVELLIRGNDMFIGTLLRSLEIEDHFKRNSGMSPRYLARSFIESTDTSSIIPLVSSERQKSGEGELSRFDSEEQFFEAAENLSEVAESPSQVQASSPASIHGDASFSPDKLSVKPPSFSRIAGLLPDAKLQINEMDSEKTGTLDSFVKAQVVFLQQDSPLYSNIDKHVAISLATLSFFCHRPTVLAILAFVNAINFSDTKLESHGDNPSIAHTKSSKDDAYGDVFETEESVVKGLLGKGKARILFSLTLNMSTAQIFLVNEEGACLVTLSQNNLIGDIKVFPSSFSVKAALGNLRISDDSLPSSHSYYWICDMRNPGGSSFVELDFSSYSTDDDDFCGYDYSLTGQLSEVRIIYLNRFIEEIVGYFMGLVPSNSESFVKLKDQVSNSEMLFTTNEIEGSPAVKLDVSLTKPIIVMPRRTDSLEYLEVDVHYISVRNSFEWVGGDKSEMNAIHLETMTIKVKEINLIVGTGEISGENIIEDVKGLSVVIQRSLRDLLHQIPVTEAVIKVEELRAALSNREYHIITECSLSNISEAPHLVPALDLDFGAPSDEIDQSGGSVILNPSASVPQDREAWITIKVWVSINLIELCLHSGSTRELPLATVQVSGAWFLFKSDSSNKSFIWATLKGFAVIDEREGTKEEFRHAIGKHESIGRFPLDYGFPVEKHECAEKHDTRSILTMLILDAKFTESSASISLCIQRPHLLVALDFLLAIAEFFVPTLRELLSDDGMEDPLKENGAIILDNPVYTQPLTEFSLSPKTPLIIDDERFDHCIYDGKGGNLYLKDSQGNNISHDSFKTLIFIGNGKTLRFKNVVIKNGKFLDSCIFLGSNSSYSASMVDDVIIGEDLTNLITTDERARAGESPQLTVNQSVGMEYLIDLQAIGPELTFYNTSKDVGESLLMSNKLLHAEMDVLCSLKMSGENTEISGNLCGLKVECNGIRVLEPFDAEVKFSNISGITKIHFSGSDVLMNFSFSILRLFLAIQEDILTFVRMTSKKISVTCSQFDKVATIQCKKGPSYSFWRPRAPPGFAVLGDCITPSNKPPSSGVLAVNTSFIKVRRPVSFKRIWPPLRADAIGDDCASTSYSGCSIWFPQAPQGYLSMGCVVSAGGNEPPLSSSFCILASLVCPCTFRDCIYLNIDELDVVNLAFWRVRNSFGSFLPTYPSNTKVNGKAYELRQLRIQNLDKFTNSVCLDSHDNSCVHDNDQLQRPPLSPSQMFEAVASFKLIWWNQGTPNQKKLSIWRPILPSGTVYFGDVAVQGYEPPNTCFVLRNSGDDSLVKPPLDFQLVAKIKKYKRVESICMWLPQAPPGYVSLGCIASKGSPKLDDFSSLRCVRSDMVTGDQFPEESIWDIRDTKISKESFSMWSIGNEVGTFVVRRGFKKPPKRYALALTHQSVSSSLDNIVIDAKINVLSAAVYDDYGGLMVPLFNISLSSIDFNLHGRPDYLNSNVNFSLNGRSYNDKYDAWEPIIEPVDAFLRYQYDANSPGANSQLRITSTRDLNLNVSTSNINTILQAYSSWNNLGQVHKSYKNKEMQPALYGGRSVTDVHHKTNYHIIPQNKLGQDVFIRDTEMNKYSIIFKMPSGDNKPIKVPVSKNLLNSHLEGKTSRLSRSMVPIVISCAELPAGRGLSKSQYIVIVRLLLNQPNMSTSDQQRARTCGAIPEKDLGSGALVVKWDEIFFFKVDIPEHYVLEFVVVDLGNGQPIGLHSAPLCEIAYKLAPCSESCGNRSGSFRPLSAINPTRDHIIQGDKNPKEKGRIKFAVFLPAENESDEQRISSSKPGFIQISPARDGPWTTVRLNYATHAACWRFGNDVVASELTVTNGTRYVNIRSLVSVVNNTDFLMDVCLKSKKSIETLDSTNNSDEHIDEDVDGCICETDEIFEIEKYMPSIGWSSDSSGPTLAHKHASHSSSGGGCCELSDGWEYIDEWQIDKSLISDNDGWVYAPDVEHLNWPDTYSEMNFINHARQRRWVRHRKYLFGKDGYVPLCSLKPGDTIPLPLPVLVHPTLSYYLKLKPNRSHGAEYSWTSVRMEHAKAEVADNVEEFSEICVSDLCESEKILYASQVDRSSSTSSGDLWFSLSIKAIEVGKDIHSDPIQDWKLKVDCPLSITNYLPLPAEYSICSKQSSGEFITISRRLFAPGETFKFYNTNLHEPLYISLLIRGWDMMHGPALISHPSKFPSKAAILRSSYSGRVAQVIFDQSHDKEHLTTRRISVYAPCWISSDRCPALLYRLLIASDGKERKSLLSLETGKNSEKIFWEITEEEFYEGCTIASAINFKSFGLSLSIEEPGSGNFGPIRNLAPLGDLDGSFDIYASGANSNCFRLSVSSKTCPYSLVPTKVISIRPHTTFTNRIGQDIFLKQSVNDQTKVLHASDSRVSFIYHDVGVPERLQVKLEDTDWSFPIEIIEEDTLTLMLKNYNGCRSFLRLEIRGYEEGSRFLVVFRLESSDGPIRIENRIEDKTIGIRQSGSEDDSWIQINSLSSTPFSWVNPYGQRCVDLFISNETDHTIQCISLEKNGECSNELKAIGVQHDVIEVGDTRIVRFSVLKDTSVKTETTLIGKTSASSIPNEAGNSTMELIMELGILGISLIDHKPRELLFLFLERVFISYSTGYAGNTCRFKLIMGQVQLDNQLPLTVMPILLAPDRFVDIGHPVFKTTITMSNENKDGTQVYPYIYVRVMDKKWRINIHEPIIWALMDFYNNLHLERLSDGSDVAQVDPEIRIDLIDVSEVRLKLALETAPTQRPIGVLGIWSPILSAIGNALKIQIHLRKIMRRNKFIRKSSILPSILNHVKRDLIHDPLHLIFSVDVLGITKSTFASLSRGFAELSTDGQFLQLRSKQVWSRNITGVRDGFLQGTEALAQGVAFGVSGVVTKPVESARQYGFLGLVHGFGRAFLGFVVQPVSGALDFVSLTVDGISTSFGRCLELLSNKAAVQRIRNPRAICASGVLKEYSEREATGQMILYLAEASRHLGCTDLFKEPSKFAWSDHYEDHFVIPYNRVLLITNNRVMLLQSLAPERLDKQPCKIIWDVPWEELMALELAKAGFPKPSHLIIHLKNFIRSEFFVRLVKCSTEEVDNEEPQAVRICVAVRRMWKVYQADSKTLTLKVPSSQRQVHFFCDVADRGDSFRNKLMLQPRELRFPHAITKTKRFTNHSVNFQKIWSSEREPRRRCMLFPKQVSDDSLLCSIWRPVCPEGYVSVGDTVRQGMHPPTVATIYRESEGIFASPVGYDLVWRNCYEDFATPLSVWHPRAPEGFVSLGCVGVPGYDEPYLNSAYCISSEITEEALLEDQAVWTAPESYPWACYFYQVQSEALQFVALRQRKEKSDWRPMRVSEQKLKQLLESKGLLDDQTEHIGTSLNA